MMYSDYVMYMCNSLRVELEERTIPSIILLVWQMVLTMELFYEPKNVYEMCCCHLFLLKRFELCCSVNANTHTLTLPLPLL